MDGRGGRNGVRAFVSWPKGNLVWRVHGGRPGLAGDWGRLVAVRVTPVADPATIVDVSQAFLSKYADSPYAQAMVAPEILSTTLRLSPI
jgi:hypothetical protein